MDSNKTEAVPSENSTEKVAEADSSPPLQYINLLSTCVEQLYEGAQSQDARPVLRMFRRFKRLRNLCDMNVLKKVYCTEKLKDAETAKETSSSASNFAHTTEHLIKWRAELKSIIEKQSGMSENSMDIDKSASSEAKLAINETPAFQRIQTIILQNNLPDVEMLISLLVLVHLLDNQQIEKAASFGQLLVTHAIQLKPHDYIFARILLYSYRAHELNSTANTLRETLLKRHREAAVHRNPMTEAVTLNLLLRNYINNGLFEAAMKLASKASLPDNLNAPAQHARFLYYTGLIKARRLEYSDAFSNFHLALRKVPEQSHIAKGFKLAATKNAIVVELLMGDIPERHLFNQKETRQELLPYRKIVLAVRAGDLQLFGQVMKDHEETFKKDATHTLLGRLHHNVIRAGLRIICLSYSCITLADIAQKLKLPDSQAAESMVAKAIADGIIEATIDHEKQHVYSRACIDAYTSNEPQKALNKRIAYCMEIYKETAKAMEYSDGTEHTLSTSDDLDERRRALKEEIAMAEDSDLGDDMDMP